MKLKGSSYFLIGIIATMVFVIVYAIRLPVFEAAITSLIIGSLVLILAMIVFLREVIARKEAVAEEMEEESHHSESAEWRSYLAPLAWMIGFFGAIYIIGLLFALAGFILAYTRSHGGRWSTAIFLGILTPALIYGAFELGLRIELYRGLLPWPPPL